MTATVKALAKTVVLLPPKDREYLAEELLASLEETDTEQQWLAAEGRFAINASRTFPTPSGQWQ